MKQLNAMMTSENDSNECKPLPRVGRHVMNRKMDDLLSSNMSLHARVILACTGINDYNNN